MSKGWRRTRLGEVATLQRGFDLPVDARRPGSIPVLAPNGPIGNHDEAQVRGPGVVTGRRGTIGRVQFVKGDYWPLSTTLFVSDFHGNDPLFVAFLLEALHLERFTEATGVPTLNPNVVHPLEVTIPPLDEQRRIAAVLSAINATNSRHDDVLNRLHDVKRAVADTLLSSMRAEWTRARLGDLAEFVNGRAFTPSDWSSSGLPIIRIQNLNGSAEYNFFEGEGDPRYLVEPGDLLFSWADTPGTSFGPHFWHGPSGVLNQHIFNVKNLRGVEKQFLFHALGMITAFLKQRTHSRAGAVRITKGQLESFEVPIPPLDEQRQIGAVLSAIETAISRTRDEIESISTLKIAVAQRLLEGIVV